MQILKPLAIGDVGLPTRYVLHVLCVDQIDFESACFQDLIDRNPVDTGRLHRHRANPALHKPVGQRMQIASESRETADQVWMSIGADGNEQLTGSASHLLLPFLTICSSDWPVGCPGRGLRANSRSRSSPESGSRHHTSVRNPRPTLYGRASNRAPMSARAVAVIRPAPTIFARLAFLHLLSGQGQLHAYKDGHARNSSGQER